MRTTLLTIGAAAAALLTACSYQDVPDNGAAANAAAPVGATLTLARLDCGAGEFKDMNGFFSDRPGVYPAGGGKVVGSCYLIRHGDQQMIWDTGFPAALEGSAKDMGGGMTASLTATLADQLGRVGLKLADIDIVGISHMHGDHTGQAADMPQAKLIIGKRDFDESAKKDDPFKPWRGDGKNVQLVSGDTDVFGDGSVKIIHLPGHTPDSLGLLVNLKSGPVLLSGDLYHSTIAREQKAMPGFNTSKPETLASMDKFEALAKETGAKVIIQHEPDDIGKLPAFPSAAE